MSSQPRTAAATSAVKQYAAERAIDNPVKLDRAERIVCAAVARGRRDITDYVRRLVDHAPPLTDDQAEKLRALLPPTPRKAGEAA